MRHRHLKLHVIIKQLRSIKKILHLIIIYHPNSILSAQLCNNPFRIGIPLVPQFTIIWRKNDHQFYIVRL